MGSIVKDQLASISELWRALKNVDCEHSHSKWTKLIELAKMKFWAVLFGLLILSITGFLHFRYDSKNNFSRFSSHTLSIPGASVKTHSKIKWFKITQLMIVGVLFGIFTLKGRLIEPITNFHTWLAQHCAFGTEFILKGLLKL